MRVDRHRAPHFQEKLVKRRLSVYSWRETRRVGDDCFQCGEHISISPALIPRQRTRKTAQIWDVSGDSLRDRHEVFLVIVRSCRQASARNSQKLKRFHQKMEPAQPGGVPSLLALAYSTARLGGRGAPSEAALERG